jgi:heme exporter protein C
MPPEMWLPLLVNVLGIYCLFAANLVVRLRAEIVRRECSTQWVGELLAEEDR